MKYSFITILITLCQYEYIFTYQSYRSVNVSPQRYRSSNIQPYRSAVVQDEEPIPWNENTTNAKHSSDPSIRIEDEESDIPFCVSGGDLVYPGV